MRIVGPYVLKTKRYALQQIIYSYFYWTKHHWVIPIKMAMYCLELFQYFSDF